MQSIAELQREILKDMNYIYGETEKLEKEYPELEGVFLKVSHSCRMTFSFKMFDNLSFILAYSNLSNNDIFKEKYPEYLESLKSLAGNIDKLMKIYEESHDRYSFKVNLPADERNYKSGNGEGCWVVCVNDEDYTRMESGEKFRFKVKLKNDSVYYPAAVYDTEILVENRNSRNRPVAVLEELIERFGECDFF